MGQVSYVILLVVLVRSLYVLLTYRPNMLDKSAVTDMRDVFVAAYEFITCSRRKHWIVKEINL